MDKRTLERAEFCSMLSTMVYTNAQKIRNRFLGTVEDINNFVFISEGGRSCTFYSKRR